MPPRAGGRYGERKEVRRVADKKECGCGCGCVLPGKTGKSDPKTENPEAGKTKATKEQKK